MLYLVALAGGTIVHKHPTPRHKVGPVEVMAMAVEHALDSMVVGVDHGHHIL